MTNFELAQTMVRLGAVTAMAFDGGGSTTMAFNGTLLNRPSGAERPISTALLFQYTGVFVQPAVAVVSPDGDGVADRQSLRYKLVRPSTTTVTLTAPDGIIAFAETRGAPAGNLRHPVPAGGGTACRARVAASPPANGRWKLQVAAVDDLGQPSEMTQTFTVNTTVGFLATTPRKLFLPPGGRDLGITWKQSRPARSSSRSRLRPARSCERSPGAPIRSALPRSSGTASIGRRRQSRAERTSFASPRRTPSGRSSSRSRFACSASSGRSRRHAVEARERLKPLPGAEAAAPRCPLQSPPDALLRPQQDHRRDHHGDRELRPLRRLPPDADRRGLPGRERGRHGLRRRDRLGCDRGHVGEPVRLHLRAGLPRLPCDRDRRHRRLPDRCRFGWEIGRRGGRPYLEKHGRWLHLDHEKLERAEAWFLRFEDWAVFVGRSRRSSGPSSRSRPGIFEAPFKRYTVLTLLGSAIWCFVFAGIGWAAARTGRASITRSGTRTSPSARSSSSVPPGSAGASGGNARLRGARPVVSDR